MPTRPALDHGASSRSRGLGCLLLAAASTLLAVAVLVLVVRHVEGERLARIEHAEDKYDLAYLRAAHDGEGGGLWRTSEGAVLACTISGDMADPVLACGDGEPPEPE